MRLFLDANVIFTAAHNPAGRSTAIVELAHRGRCGAATSPHAAAEARRNVALKNPDALPRLDALMRCLEVVPEAAADAPILACRVRRFWRGSRRS